MRFNLNDYETVEQRIKRFYEMYPDGRIVTKLVDEVEFGDKPKLWVFKAFVYLTAGDQANKLPKATGYASEREIGAQADWKAELGETSAIGRALANMNLSGNKRASREEMQKVQRGSESATPRDYLAEAEKTLSVTELRNIYAEAKAANAPQEVLDKIKDYGQILGAGSENQGTGGRISASPKKGRP